MEDISHVMTQERKYKGDVAETMVIADLTKKGYNVLTPTVCKNIPFNLVAYKDGKLNRVQVKYTSDGHVSNKNVWNDKHGTHQHSYASTAFDYYGIYLAKINEIIYPSIKFGGVKITTSIPNSATPFWWWEDFKEFTDIAVKKHYKDFGIELAHNKTDAVINSRIKRRKVMRPSKEELVEEFFFNSVRKRFWC